VAAIPKVPQLEPYWAAGFSFSRGHFKVRVPYDAYQPMVFQGEEIGISVRGWTSGYDFYATHDSVVFHEYAVKSKRRTKVHMFWENTKHAGEGKKSLLRATSVIHLAEDIDAASWDHSELDRYGIGTDRDYKLFYKLFLIDVQARKATQLCPFVKSGLMHNHFTPHLRPNGLGIDYSQLNNFDTLAVLEEHLTKQHPMAREMIDNAIKNNRIGALQSAKEFANKVHLKGAYLDKLNNALKHVH
jgi:hypothetical protein